VYEGGVLRPLDSLKLAERQQVKVTVESADARDKPDVPVADDPLAGLQVNTGIADLAEHFDDYRHGPAPS
jgi:hypothetical protein